LPGRRSHFAGQLLLDLGEPAEGKRLLASDGDLEISNNRELKVAISVAHFIRRTPERRRTAGVASALTIFTGADIHIPISGGSVMEYLIAWRTAMAKRLRKSSACQSIAVAERAGYGSESAFSTAFRRAGAA
jgi:methylphosphotriester-DNA--protein-cysteine methyltransferase